MQPLYVLSTEDLVIGVFDNLTKLKNEIKFDKRKGKRDKSDGKYYSRDRSGWISLKYPTYNLRHCPPMDMNNFEKIVKDRIDKSKLKRTCLYLVDEERSPSDGESLRNNCHETLETYNIHQVLLNNDITPLYALDGEKFKAAEKEMEQLINN